MFVIHHKLHGFFQLLFQRAPFGCNEKRQMPLLFSYSWLERRRLFHIMHFESQHTNINSSRVPRLVPRLFPSSDSHPRLVPVLFPSSDSHPRLSMGWRIHSLPAPRTDRLRWLHCCVSMVQGEEERRYSISETSLPLAASLTAEVCVCVCAYVCVCFCERVCMSPCTSGWVTNVKSCYGLDSARKIASPKTCHSPHFPEVIAITEKGTDLFLESQSAWTL